MMMLDVNLVLNKIQQPANSQIKLPPINTKTIFLSPTNTYEIFNIKYQKYEN